MNSIDHGGERHMSGGHDGTGMWHVFSGHDGTDVLAKPARWEPLLAQRSRKAPAEVSTSSPTRPAAGRRGRSLNSQRAEPWLRAWLQYQPTMARLQHSVRAAIAEDRRCVHVSAVAAVVRAAADARRLRWRGGCTPCAPLPPRANGARTFALPCRSKLVTPVALAKRVAEPSDAGAAAVCAAAAEDRSRAVAALVIDDRGE
jgi:hypothetical protein